MRAHDQSRLQLFPCCALHSEHMANEWLIHWGPKAQTRNFTIGQLSRAPHKTRLKQVSIRENTLPQLNFFFPILPPLSFPKNTASVSHLHKIHPSGSTSREPILRYHLRKEGEHHTGKSQWEWTMKSLPCNSSLDAATRMFYRCCK